MKALVLCAGYGNRLGSLTQETAKAMLHIGGEPLLAHTLRYLAHHGFGQIAINLHYQPESIKDYCGDGSRFDVDLHYSYEETLLGTAGAVKNLEGYFADAEDFLVIYGDLLLTQDLAPMLDFHRDKNASATLLLHQRVASNSLVNMDENQRIIDFIERPTPAQREQLQYPWVNSGVQVLNRRILAHIPAGKEVDLPRDTYPSISGTELLYGFPLTGNRCAIDSPERYAEAQAAMALGHYAVGAKG